jgi:hypothetical protein
MLLTLPIDLCLELIKITNFEAIKIAMKTFGRYLFHCCYLLELFIALVWDLIQIFTDTSLTTSARNGNLEVPVYFLKAK